MLKFFIDSVTRLFRFISTFDCISRFYLSHILLKTKKTEKILVD